jgi:hypothetical protein
MVRKLPAYMTEILLGKGVKETNKRRLLANVTLFYWFMV